jgi:hypothetical protein
MTEHLAPGLRDPGCKGFAGQIRKGRLFFNDLPGRNGPA